MPKSKSAKRKKKAKRRVQRLQAQQRRQQQGAGPETQSDAAAKITPAKSSGGVVGGQVGR